MHRNKRRPPEKSRHMPVAVRCFLWGRSAGRCEFAGCNRLLCLHPETKQMVNLAEVAHIVGFSEDGPRGEAELSAELVKDPANLMLLCGLCHDTIDARKDDYPVARLTTMKRAHERRIETIASITEDRKRHIVLYGANVGEQCSPLSYMAAANAMFPEAYPAETTPIDLEMKNSAFLDRDATFWEVERVNLIRLVDQRLRTRLAAKEIAQLAVFAIAPQPLLMLLGSLLSDITDAVVHQLHREPRDWRWRRPREVKKFKVAAPTTATGGHVALVLAVSATVTDERIVDVLGAGVAIWRLDAEAPDKDFLRSRDQLEVFRRLVRETLDQIKARHGEQATLHVFPALPVAAAVEFGRVISPKADLHMVIHDQNTAAGGFVRAIELNDTRTAARLA